MSDYDFSFKDIDSMINDAAFDFNSVNDVDLSSYLTNSGAGSINGLELPGDFNADPNAFSLGDIDSMLGDAALNVGDFFDTSAPLLTPDGIDESFTGNLNDAEFNRYLETLDPGYKSPLADLPEQEMQITPENQASFDANLTDIMDNRGGFTSQWQQAGTDRIMVNDDGTGIGINENGDSYALSKPEVDQMVKNKQLNTFESGYNTATGGTKIAPGGGRPVTLNNGKIGTLKPDGTVIDNDSGKKIGTDKDVKDGEDGKGGGGKGGNDGKGGGSGSSNKSGDLNSLLPLLLALLAMNRGGGGGGSSGAVIPGLTATQKQTPYAQQQRAPGYRPGQGGISYFNQTQYTPKMAAGGGIARLLDGPGDGVSDSIPAVIGGDGMARGGQPAKLARGEYIIDARTVAALGNGSTDAGAERLDKMRKDILRDDRKAGVGKDSKAYRHLLA